MSRSEAKVVPRRRVPCQERGPGYDYVMKGTPGTKATKAARSRPAHRHDEIEVQILFGNSTRLMVQQRRDMDAALLKRGQDPEQVGIFWATKVIAGETKKARQRRRANC